MTGSNKRSEPNKLHVVMLIDAWFPFYGGGQIHVKNLSQYLTENYPVTVKIFHSTSSNILSRLLWSLTVIFQVTFYRLNHRIDILHSHGFVPGLPAKVLSLLLKLPVVHTVHGSHLMDQSITSSRAWLEKFLLTQIKYSALITVSSNFLKYKNTNKQIKVIPNGVNVANFDRVRVKKAPDPTILFVGRRHPDKGIDTLLQAYKTAKQKIPNLKLDIIDGGVVGKNLIKRYKRSHLFILPSKAEGQPISLLEAWSARLPVIVTKVGDNPNMIKYGYNGFLINPGDSKQLAKHILEIFDKPAQAKKMGSNGYNLVRKDYTWPKIANQTYQVYLDLLE